MAVPEIGWPPVVFNLKKNGLMHPQRNKNTVKLALRFAKFSLLINATTPSQLVCSFNHINASRKLIGLWVPKCQMHIHKFVNHDDNLEQLRAN